uniref:Uncharacterized protein n=1 Tax=Acrobeloides nanus TaxID=290746 RepID=A0A914D9C8_9BILA
MTDQPHRFPAGPRPTIQKRKYPNPMKIRELEKALDLTGFINQLEELINRPIKIPPVRPSAGTSRHARHGVFSVKDIWQNKEEQKKEVSKLYNAESLGERQWLLDLLTEESDSEDSGGEEHFTQQNLKELLKIHRRRRTLQTQYHNDIMNSQYTYYSAGLLSNHDRFPEHQKEVQKQFFFEDGV